jgi:hypothetical protein
MHRTLTFRHLNPRARERSDGWTDCDGYDEGPRRYLCTKFGDVVSLKPRVGETHSGTYAHVQPRKKRQWPSVY